MKKIIICALVGLLNGCNQYKMYVLKGSVFEEIDDTITLEHALTTRSMCTDVDWTSKKDYRDRSVVVYRCTLVGYHTPMGVIYDQHADKERIKFGPELEELTKVIKAHQEKLDQLNQLNEALTEVRDKGLDKQLVHLRGRYSLPVDYTYLFKDDMVSSNKLLWSRDAAARKTSSEIIALEFQINTIFKNHNIGSKVEGWFKVSNAKAGGIDPFNLDPEAWDEHYQEFKEAISKPLDEAKAKLNAFKVKTEGGRESIIPTSMVQNVVFSMDTGVPKLLSCDFEAFYETGTVKNYLPKSANAKQSLTECFKMAYDYEFTEGYTRLFELIVEDQ